MLLILLGWSETNSSIQLPAFRRPITKKLPDSTKEMKIKKKDKSMYNQDKTVTQDMRRKEEKYR